MYDEFPLIDLSRSNRSVLDRLNIPASRNVATVVVDGLSTSLGLLTVTSADRPNNFLSDEDLKWFMQITSYALGLSFSPSDYPTIRSTTKLYCDWLTCATKEPSSGIPAPLNEQPLFYASNIINHFHNLFMRRAESTNTDVVLRQAKECHHVLRCIENTMFKVKDGLKADLWRIVLRFLLSISDHLLSSPIETDDVSDQLCERLLRVLFKLWLSAIADNNFPSPSYWKTFRALIARWRHRPQTVDHWVRVSCYLTYRQLRVTYPDDFCKMTIADDDKSLLPESTSPALIAQTWFRVLHLVEDPVKHLRHVNSILTGTDKSNRQAEDNVSEESTDTDTNVHPQNHVAYLTHWQYSFYRMMRGIHCIICGLLGEPIDCDFKQPEKALKEVNSMLNQRLSSQVSVTAGGQATSAVPAGSGNQSVSLIKAAMSLGSSSKAKGAKFSVPGKTTVHLNQLPDSAIVYAILKTSPIPSRKYSDNQCSLRPTVQSLMKLFGKWLFAVAAFKIDIEAVRKVVPFEDSVSQKSAGSQQSASDPESSGVVFRSPGQTTEIKNFLESMSSISGYQAARAETLAALCRIFAAKRPDENLPDQTLCQFLSILFDAFNENDTVITSYMMCHATDLFRVELKNVELLVPYVLDCMDALCIEPDRSRIHPSLTDVLLRSACLNILSSLLCLPTVQGMVRFSDLNSTDGEQFTFIGMRSKILRVLLHELKIETDSHNLQFCIAIFSLFCHASWLWERRHDADVSQMSPSESSRYFGEISRLVIPQLSESLCGKWSADYGVCISTLDCFCFLTSYIDCVSEDKSCLNGFLDVVMSLCRFIDLQLGKPPPAHSRDMHSTVVAAYHCLEVVLVAAPALIKQAGCLRKVAQVVQLGVTGVRAESPMNGEVEVESKVSKKSASQRVHDAAEQLCHTLFNRVGHGFSMCSAPENEAFLLDHMRKQKADIELKFNYYLVDNTTVFALANATLDYNLPTAALVVRSPFSPISSWLLNFRNCDNEKDSIPPIVERPRGVPKTKTVFPAPRYFPSELDKIERIKNDELFFTEFEMTPELEEIKTKIKDYWELRKNTKPRPEIPVEDERPIYYTEVNPSKLFLKSFGFIDIDNDPSQFKVLDIEEWENFQPDLEKMIDNCPPRLIHTVHIFYVARGQIYTDEILKNGGQIKTLPTDFRQFLSNLGAGINVKESCLWSGHFSTSFNNESSSAKTELHDSLFLDGIDHALYFATSLIEMAFLVPSVRSRKWINSESSRTTKAENAHPVPPPRSKSLSQDVLEHFHPNQFANASSSASKTVGQKKKQPLQQDYRIFVVWMEDLQNADKFPVEDLLPMTELGEEAAIKAGAVFVLFLTPMKSGLYFVKAGNLPSKLGSAHPLVNGMMVSFDLLANAVRQTALSVANRRRLENEIFVPPFIRRRHKIQEFGAKYAKDLSYREILTHVIKTW